MLLHNLKFAFRSLLKNKLYIAFNIIGFSVALSVCIIISLFLYREFSVDSFYKNAENVYRLVDKENNSVEIDRTVAIGLPEQFPEIETSVPVYYAQFNDYSFFVKYPSGRTSVQLSGIVSTTNDFFRMANLNIISARSPEPFSDNKSVVISKSLASKLFGNADILGEEVTFFNMSFMVSAIVEDMPTNSSIRADCYIHTDTPDYRLGNTCIGGDCYLRRNIWLSLLPGTNPEKLVEKMNGHLPENKTNTQLVTLQPLRSVYFKPTYGDNANITGNLRMIYIIITIAALTLLMSVFNYLNFSVSKQLSTLKDSGVRIANGAGMGHLRSYYITEVGLTVFISLLVALLISRLVLPYSEILFNEKLSYTWLLRYQLFLPLFAVLVLVVVTASLASVTFISRFTPQVLFAKSAIRLGNYSIRQLLTIGQLTISVILITCLMFIDRQLKYVKTADVGFNKELLLRIDVPMAYKSYENLRSEFGALSFVKDFSLTSHTPGSGWSKNIVKNESGQRVEVNAVNIDDNFLKTFGLKIVKGRDLLNSDIDRGCFVTQATVKQLEWDGIKGKKFNGMNVLGVVNDININSMHTAIVPVAFLYSKHYFNALNLRLIPGNTGQQIEHIRRIWKNLLPDEHLSFAFYNDYYNSLYIKEDRQEQALTVFSIIALIITCLGLLGQIMQTSERRVKEIGIRKINGAGIQEVVAMLNREYIFSVFIAFIVAVPITYFTIRGWLENFAYKTTLSWWIFALAGALALGIALLTVSWQSWRAATRNPVEALRYE